MVLAGAQGGGAAVLTRGRDRGHDLLAPGMLIRVGVGGAAAAAIAIVGVYRAEEGIVAVIGDAAAAVLDAGGAVRIVIGGAVGDRRCPHAGIGVQVAGQVLPVGLGVVGRPVLVVVTTVIVAILHRPAVAEGHLLELVGGAILVDGGGDGAEQVLAGTILLRQRHRVVAGPTWAALQI